MFLLKSCGQLPDFKTINNLPLIKIYFLEKINRPRSTLDLARVEKGEVTPVNKAPKSYLQLIVENYYWASQYEFGDQTVKAGKNSQLKGFVTRFIFFISLSCFFCIRFLFKNFIVSVIFSNQYPN